MMHPPDIGFSYSMFPPHLPSQMSALPVTIAGTGKFLPAQVVTATQIDARLGMAAGWTLKHTGVAERRFVTTETAAEMGAAALVDAMAAAGQPGVDLLISASGTPQQIIPCTAALISREIGWAGVPCMDVNATCLSFIAALDLASMAIAVGRYHTVAIVSAEIASKGLNWKQPESAALMGDGAAAVILTRAATSTTSAVLGCCMETWPEGAHLTEIRGGGSALPAKEHRVGENTDDYLFHMDGPGIFRLAAQRMEPFVASLVGNSADRWDAIDVILPHQGSLTAMRHLRRRLGIPKDKLVEIAQTHGNAIAAGLPMALHEAISSGKLVRGQTALFLGTSAGFSLGGGLIRY
jgi:3-oxoacyl-[acyl-carrier-protein] synthase III